MAEEIARLTTVWDANFQKLDEKMNAINRKVAASTSRMKKDMDSFTNQLEQRYGRVGKAMGNVFNDSRLATIQAGAGHLRIFGSALEPLGVAGLAAAAGVAALAVASQQAIAAMKFADEIDDASQKLAIGTDALQEYRFAMTEVGGEAGDADTAIKSFNETLGAAQSGLSPKAMKGFAALGFTKEQINSFSSGEEALGAVAAKIAALSKESEQAAVAEKLGLGALLPLLREGEEGMEALRQKARDLGIVMDAELVAKGAEANQQFETMSQVISVQLKSAFVELSDEVVGFVTAIANALTALNRFIERANAMKANLGGFGAGDILNMGTAGGLVKGGFRLARGAIRGPQMVGFPTGADIESLMAPDRPAGGTSLIPPAARGGGRRGRDTTEQRARRQEQFEKQLDRVQAELLRAYDHEFESISSDAGNKLAQIQQEHEAKLREIVAAEAEYAKSNGLRGLSATEAGQLRAAQEQLRAYDQANVRWHERRDLEEYRFQTEQDAADAAIELLDIQAGMAVTARERHEAERRILALTLEAERNAQQRDLNNDPNIDDAERERRLAEGDKGRDARRDAQGRSSDGARQARGIAADILAPADWVQQAADAYAEIDRLRQDDVLSEEEAARAKALIHADLNEKRLGSTRTMLDTLSTLQNSSNKKLAALGKAAAIAQATIDGVLAVQKALASAPPPFNFVQAAIVGAVAAANVASIAGMADGGLVTGPGGPREDKVLRRLSPGEFVVNAASTARNRALLESLNNGGDLGSLGASRSGAGAFTYAPTIDARGASMEAARHFERVLDQHKRDLPAIINGTREQRAKYRLGRRAS